MARDTPSAQSLATFLADRVDSLDAEAQRVRQRLHDLANEATRMNARLDALDHLPDRVTGVHDAVGELKVEIAMLRGRLSTLGMLGLTLLPVLAGGLGFLLARGLR